MGDRRWQKFQVCRTNWPYHLTYTRVFRENYKRCQQLYRRGILYYFQLCVFVIFSIFTMRFTILLTVDRRGAVSRPEACRAAYVWCPGWMVHQLYCCHTMFSRDAISSTVSYYTTPFIHFYPSVPPQEHKYQIVWNVKQIFVDIIRMKGDI